MKTGAGGRPTQPAIASRTVAGSGPVSQHILPSATKGAVRFQWQAMNGTDGNYVECPQQTFICRIRRGEFVSITGGAPRPAWAQKMDARNRAGPWQGGQKVEPRDASQLIEQRNPELGTGSHAVQRVRTHIERILWQDLANSPRPNTPRTGDARPQLMPNQNPGFESVSCRQPRNVPGKAFHRRCAHSKRS